jgi:hypothetical protein
METPDGVGEGRAKPERYLAPDDLTNKRFHV